MISQEPILTPNPGQTPEQVEKLLKIAREQGTLEATAERLWGSGQDLWTDEEFEAFIEFNRRSRAVKD